MSQRRRSRRVARERWREQAARLVARASWPDESAGPCVRCEGKGRVDDPHGRAAMADCKWCDGSGRKLAVAAKAVLGGADFDVSAVRAYCERLVAEGEQGRVEQVAFTDWARERTPDTPVPFAFKVALGWPGSLAREYGWERCKACEGRGRTESRDYEGALQGWLPCTACKGRGRTRKPGIPPGFANGDSIARTAKRLLDTLDGRCPWAPSAKAQASECKCAGNGYVYEAENRRGPWVECPCRGTGHNLAGVLPEVEHPRPYGVVLGLSAGVAHG